MSNNPIYWKQKNGVLISVDDMDINHLRNVLKMIIRGPKKVLPKIEPKINGHMAQSLYEAANDGMGVNDSTEVWD